MKNSTNQGFDQHDNAQIAVDQASLLSVGESLSPHPNAQAAAEPTLESISPEMGTPAAAALDDGSSSAATIELFERRHIAPYLATGRDPHHPSWQERFAAPPPRPPMTPVRRYDGL